MMLTNDGVLDMVGILLGRLDPERMPYPEDWRELAGSLMRKRGRPGFLRSVRADASERARALHAMIGWHVGTRGPSLWGPMIARMRVGAEFDSIDTLAQVVALAVTRGRESAGASAWRRALGITS